MQFVLVHGGWQGGWCWDAVSAALRTEGHEVFAPTLRGSEQGVAVDRAGVNLTTIGDGLVDAVRERGLQDFVVVGHSGGGPVAQHAADRLAEHTRRIVFIDAWVLHDGQAINDVLPAPLVEAAALAAQQTADQTVAMDPQRWSEYFMNGASEHDIAAVASRLVPVPFGWLSEPVSLSRFWGAALPSSYVFLRQDQNVPQELYRAMASRLDQPRLLECDGPHEAMLTHPNRLAATLIDAAKDRMSMCAATER
jgi:pimeloyl-ACP methyl ester carboxylesterase